jgi:alpha-L-rhamnosidase
VAPSAIDATGAVSPADFPEARWRGHWIWVPEQPVEPAPGWAAPFEMDRPEAHALFRRGLGLSTVPARVPARITADSRYRLLVNGEEVGRGPVRSQFRRLHYDLYDLAPFLRAGANELAVYVKYYGRERAFWMPAIPNRTLGRTGILAFEADLGGGEWLVSDDAWSARLSDAWDVPAPQGGDMVTHGIPTEIHDARRLAPDWATAPVDATWGAAQIVPAMLSGTCRSNPPTHPYGPLLPRPIAALGGDRVEPVSATAERRAWGEATAVTDPIVRNERVYAAPLLEAPSPVSLPADLVAQPASTLRLDLDMGRIVAGLVEVEVDAPAGTEIDFSFLEEPMREDAGGFGRMRAGCRYIARGRDDRYQFFDTVGFRYANVLVSGDGAVRLGAVRVREHLYPWQDAATFECSDPELNRIFTAGLRTVALCSSDAFVDCPTREQRAWVGDGIVAQMVHFAANADWRLALRYLELANSPRSDGILPMFVVSSLELVGGYTLPDWSLHWVHGVYNAYRYQGDRAAILRLLPTVVRVLRWYAEYQTATGVLRDVSDWNLIDWSSVSTADTSAAITGLWARGLRELAEMAGWLGEEATRLWAIERHAAAVAGFEAFWDEARGIYVDHVVDGVRMPETNQIAGAVAIAGGLAPRERWARVVEALTDDGRLVVRSWSGGAQDAEKVEKTMRGIYEIDWDVEREIVRAEPFMNYVVHDAVVDAGRADLLPRLHRRWLEFLEGGYDTLGENWEVGTHCHGWSAAPTRDALTSILGITPSVPGFERARVAPVLGGLAWARGDVPTPHGRLSVDVTPERCLVDSPVPVDVVFGGRAMSLPAGPHVVRAR